jgi:hypothetical protein
LACDRFQITCWVGRVDLDLEFAVADVTTGAAIPGARVKVQPDTAIYEGRDGPEFVLVTDTNGIARKECRDSMCYGAQSFLRFTNTFVVRLPWWRFRVNAAEYEPTEWTELNVLEYTRRGQRTVPGKAQVIVPVPLKKRPNQTLHLTAATFLVSRGIPSLSGRGR